MEQEKQREVDEAAKEFERLRRQRLAREAVGLDWIWEWALILGAILAAAWAISMWI